MPNNYQKHAYPILEYTKKQIGETQIVLLFATIKITQIPLVLAQFKSVKKYAGYRKF